MKIVIFAVLISLCASYDISEMRTIRNLASGVESNGPLAQFFYSDNKGNYDFGYNVQNGTSGYYHRERGDELGDKVGSYGITDADGKIRIVNYLADNYGFTADIKSNEPNLGSDNPAFVIVSKQIPDINTGALKNNPELIPLPYGYRLGVRKLVNPFPI